MNLLIEWGALGVATAILWFYIDLVRFGVPATPTMRWTRDAMLSLVPEGTRGHIMALGSGWGGMALAAARQNPKCAVTGIERSALPHWFSSLRLLLNPSVKNLRFVRSDLFETDIRDAAVIMVYLTNPLMAKLRGKLLAELPPGALVISSTFFIPDWPPEKIVEAEGPWNVKIFVYRKG